MATITAIANKLNANIAQSVASTRMPIAYHEQIVDFAVAAAAKGSALAAADVIQAINVPAGSVVLSAGLEVITAVSGGVTVLTVDLGVTALDPDAFIAAYNLFAGVAGDYAPKALAGSEGFVGNTATTVDLLLKTQTGTLAAGSVRVWAFIGDISDQRKPGIVQLKS